MAASLNHYYGHNWILARYVGLEKPPPILGYLLHGWHPWFPWMPDVEDIRASVKGRLPVLAWSSRDVEELQRGGVKNVTAIGAPFLYKLRMRGVPQLPDRPSLVTFPFHTIASSAFEDTWSEYADYLASLESFDAVTVCLYPDDYENPDVRAKFERHGFSVTTNGTAANPAFLDNFYDLVAKHSAVSSNRVSTAVVYGAAMGRRAFLGGRVPAVTRQQSAGHIEAESARTVSFQREHFPELLMGVGPDRARELGWSQLGAESLKEPDELRRVLGWSGARRPIAHALAAGAAMRRRLGLAPDLRTSLG